MSVYLITDLDIHDSEVFAEYQARFPSIIERHGGRYLVRATFNDPDYQPLIAIRERSARSKAFTVDGVQGRPGSTRPLS